MSLIEDDVLVAMQSSLCMFVLSRKPSLLKRLVLTYHLRITFRSEEDDGHTVPVEACQDILIWPFGNWADMRLEISVAALLRRIPRRIRTCRCRLLV